MGPPRPSAVPATCSGTETQHNSSVQDSNEKSKQTTPLESNEKEDQKRKKVNALEAENKSKKGDNPRPIPVVRITRDKRVGSSVDSHRCRSDSDVPESNVRSSSAPASRTIAVNDKGRKSDNITVGPPAGKQSATAVTATAKSPTATDSDPQNSCPSASVPPPASGPGCTPESAPPKKAIDPLATANAPEQPTPDLDKKKKRNKKKKKRKANKGKKCAISNTEDTHNDGDNEGSDHHINWDDDDDVDMVYSAEGDEYEVNKYGTFVRGPLRGLSNDFDEVRGRYLTPMEAAVKRLMIRACYGDLIDEKRKEEEKLKAEQEKLKDEEAAKGPGNTAANAPDREGKTNENKENPAEHSKDDCKKDAGKGSKKRNKRKVGEEHQRSEEGIMDEEEEGVRQGNTPVAKVPFGDSSGRAEKDQEDKQTGSTTPPTVPPFRGLSSLPCLFPPLGGKPSASLPESTKLAKPVATLQSVLSVLTSPLTQPESNSEQDLFPSSSATPGSKPAHTLDPSIMHQKVPRGVKLLAAIINSSILDEDGVTPMPNPIPIQALVHQFAVDRELAFSAAMSAQDNRRTSNPEPSDSILPRPPILAPLPQWLLPDFDKTLKRAFRGAKTMSKAIFNAAAAGGGEFFLPGYNNNGNTSGAGGGYQGDSDDSDEVYLDSSLTMSETFTLASVEQLHRFAKMGKEIERLFDLERTYGPDPNAGIYGYSCGEENQGETNATAADEEPEREEKRIEFGLFLNQEWDNRKRSFLWRLGGEVTQKKGQAVKSTTKTVSRAAGIVAQRGQSITSVGAAVSNSNSTTNTTEVDSPVVAMLYENARARICRLALEKAKTWTEARKSEPSLTQVSKGQTGVNCKTPDRVDHVRQYGYRLNDLEVHQGLDFVDRLASTRRRLFGFPTGCLGCEWERDIDAAPEGTEGGKKEQEREKVLGDHSNTVAVLKKPKYVRNSKAKSRPKSSQMEKKRAEALSAVSASNPNPGVERGCTEDARPGKPDLWPYCRPPPVLEQSDIPAFPTVPNAPIASALPSSTSEPDNGLILSFVEAQAALEIVTARSSTLSQQVLDALTLVEHREAPTLPDQTGHNARKTQTADAIFLPQSWLDIEKKLRAEDEKRMKRREKARDRAIAKAKRKGGRHGKVRKGKQNKKTDDETDEMWCDKSNCDSFQAVNRASNGKDKRDDNKDAVIQLLRRHRPPRERQNQDEEQIKQQADSTAASSSLPTSSPAVESQITYHDAQSKSTANSTSSRLRAFIPGFRIKPGDPFLLFLGVTGRKGTNSSFCPPSRLDRLFTYGEEENGNTEAKSEDEKGSKGKGKRPKEAVGTVKEGKAERHVPAETTSQVTAQKRESQGEGESGNRTGTKSKDPGSNPCEERKGGEQVFSCVSCRRNNVGNDTAGQGFGEAEDSMHTVRGASGNGKIGIHILGDECTAENRDNETASSLFVANRPLPARAELTQPPPPPPFGFDPATDPNRSTVNKKRKSKSLEFTKKDEDECNEVLAAVARAAMAAKAAAAKGAAIAATFASGTRSAKTPETTEAGPTHPRSPRFPAGFGLDGASDDLDVSNNNNRVEYPSHLKRRQMRGERRSLQQADWTTHRARMVHASGNEYHDEDLNGGGGDDDKDETEPGEHKSEGVPDNGENTEFWSANEPDEYYRQSIPTVGYYQLHTLRTCPAPAPVLPPSSFLGTPIPHSSSPVPMSSCAPSLKYPNEPSCCSRQSKAISSSDYGVQTPDQFEVSCPPHSVHQLEPVLSVSQGCPSSPSHLHRSVASANSPPPPAVAIPPGWDSGRLRVEQAWGQSRGKRSVFSSDSDSDSDATSDRTVITRSPMATIAAEMSALSLSQPPSNLKRDSEDNLSEKVKSTHGRKQNHRHQTYLSSGCQTGFGVGRARDWTTPRDPMWELPDPFVKNLKNEIRGENNDTMTSRRNDTEVDEENEDDSRNPIGKTNFIESTRKKFQNNCPSPGNESESGNRKEQTDEDDSEGTEETTMGLSWRQPKWTRRRWIRTKLRWANRKRRTRAVTTRAQSENARRAKVTGKRLRRGERARAEWISVLWLTAASVATPAPAPHTPPAFQPGEGEDPFADLFADPFADPDPDLEPSRPFPLTRSSPRPVFSAFSSSSSSRSSSFSPSFSPPLRPTTSVRPAAESSTTALAPVASEPTAWKKFTEAYPARQWLVPAILAEMELKQNAARDQAIERDWVLERNRVREWEMRPEIMGREMELTGGFQSNRPRDDWAGLVGHRDPEGYGLGHHHHRRSHFHQSYEYDHYPLRNHRYLNRLQQRQLSQQGQYRHSRERQSRVQHRLRLQRRPHSQPQPLRHLRQYLTTAPAATSYITITSQPMTTSYSAPNLLNRTAVVAAPKRSLTEQKSEWIRATLHGNQC